jgi:hypothetical protein
MQQHDSLGSLDSETTDASGEPAPDVAEEYAESISIDPTPDQVEHYLELVRDPAADVDTASSSEA